jgi:hypothetical protein
MNRAVLGLAGLLLLLSCLPWGTIALYGVLGAFPYETSGTCYAGRPVWAFGQLIVAVAGVIFAGRAAIAAMATAAQERRDVGRRWLGLAYALAPIALWLLLVLVLEPDGTPVAAAECA